MLAVFFYHTDFQFGSNQKANEGQGHTAQGFQGSDDGDTQKLESRLTDKYTDNDVSYHLGNP